jgi:hypothetical protein
VQCDHPAYIKTRGSITPLQPRYFESLENPLRGIMLLDCLIAVFFLDDRRDSTKIRLVNMLPLTLPRDGIA